MSKKLKYQTNLSESSPILLDDAHKTPKVMKMLAILRSDNIIANRKELAVDVGCSGGLFAEALSPFFDRVVGIDIDEKALEVARKRRSAANVEFKYGDSMMLPFEDESVDLLTCNHVYEHVPSVDTLFKEINRVLKKNGVCYLGAASRLTVVEPHYHLPFLSWLPKFAANYYMRMAGKGEEYYESLRTLAGIKEMISDFIVTDYTLDVIEKPDEFHARDMIPAGGVVDRLPGAFLRLIYPFLPSYIFLLRRKVSE